MGIPPITADDQYYTAMNIPLTVKIPGVLNNDFDYDLLSAAFPSGHEKHGLAGTPRYVQGAGFNFETKKGMFQLAPGSMGIDAGVVIPNFCEPVNENHPDIGAHESETAKMQFGVEAKFVPVSPAK